MEECPTLRLMKILGRKWILVILRELEEKERRFNELNKNLKGISSRTLSKRLKELDKAKIIGKKSYKEIPPHVGYFLTEAGKDLINNFDHIDNWVSKWGVKI